MLVLRANPFVTVVGGGWHGGCEIGRHLLLGQVSSSSSGDRGIAGGAPTAVCSGSNTSSSGSSCKGNLPVVHCLVGGGELELCSTGYTTSAHQAG